MQPHDDGVDLSRPPYMHGDFYSALLNSMEIVQVAEMKVLIFRLYREREREAAVCVMAVCRGTSSGR